MFALLLVAPLASVLASGSPWNQDATSMRRTASHPVGMATSDPDPMTLYEERHFNCTTDHFGFTELPKFSLRYFVNTTFWDKEGGGPIFFYTGNEAPISAFIKNTGALLEWAVEFKAAVVFAEHRYYGDDWTHGSFPFGTDSFTNENIKYLTVEQALADFVELTLALRVEWGAVAETAVVTFGGSYGANLAMWSRLKNPNVYAGAIASSVSVQKHLLRESNAFWMIVTEVYANISTTCPTLIKAGWDALATQGQTAAGRLQIQKELGLCQAPSSADAAVGLGGWYNGAIETMAQYGYPYPTSFYNPVPGFPFKVACEQMVKVGTPLGALRAAAEVYYNYTGQAGACFGFGQAEGSTNAATAATPRQGTPAQAQAAHAARVAATATANPSSNDAVPSGWGYQTCTEVYQPTPSNGLYPAPGGDMFPVSVPNKSDIFERCRQQYGVVPRPDWEENHFWGPNIGAGSNIFLSAGQVDPWRAAGIPLIRAAAGGSATPSDTIEIHENLMGAHHYDIRSSNPLDTDSVKECRVKQKAAIGRWIAGWRASPPLPVTSC